jgi:hypothetical protein
MIDPTIALGFRSPTAASADSSKTSTLATLSQLMGLRQLRGRLRGGQSLGGFMTGGTPAAQVTTPGDTAAVPGPSTPPAMLPSTTQLPGTGTGSLMTGLSQHGEAVYSHDGGKTWFSSQTGIPVAAEGVWGQTIT